MKLLDVAREDYLSYPFERIRTECQFSLASTFPCFDVFMVNVDVEWFRIVFLDIK